MKKLILKSTVILFLLSIVIISCNKETIKDELSFELQGEKRESNLKSTNYGYLDVSIDPVNAEGVTAEFETELIANGWVLIALTDDALVDEQFKDSETGELYFKTGILKKGTMIWSPFEELSMAQEGDIFIIAACANIYSHWRWMVRAE